ncbi:protein CURVATURE THYLAKOID 1A, chloroplastic-like [Primulina tabacum]|uniref:protein CURVATURE THYLAKOID 1A, chloroplastic-like n=1 Tax=Primulina tabacum TaxID=48773 RepID=UPI003F599A1D
MAAASSTSMAATAVFMHSLPATKLAAHVPALPLRRVPTSIPLNQISGSRRTYQLRVRASSSDESSPIDANELFTDLKEKWDAIEDKSTVLLYGGGAIVALWLATIVVGAINSVPLLPKLLELVGLGYTGWFVYRYLLYKSSRKELVEDIEALGKKISGVE